MRQYGKLCTIIYDLDKKFASPDEINFYTSFVNTPQAKILEPMCGSGRFYIPLLKAGYNITGFDASPAMLAACRKRCKAYNLTPHLFRADIIQFQDRQQYDYIIIPIGSVSLIIDEEDLLHCLENMRVSLSKNGEFIFSILNPGSPTEDINEWQEKMRYLLDDKEIICKQKMHYLPEQSLLDIKLLYELRQEGNLLEQEYQDFPIRLYTQDIINQLLQQAGFSEVSTKTWTNQFTVFCCKAI